MAVINENEFKKILKSNSFSGVYMIYGDEKFPVRKYTDKLIECVCTKEPNEFNYHKFTSFEDLNEISSAADIIPFSSEYNCVFICDADSSSAAKGTQSENELAGKLIEILNKANDETIIIISQPTISLPLKGVQKKIVDYCTKNGTVLKFDKMAESDVSKYLIKLAEKRGCVLSRSNASLIIQRLQNDLNILTNEVEKLCAYAENREITKDDIELLVSESIEYSIFKLSDFVINQNPQQAYILLDDLFLKKEPAELILSILSGAFCDMYKVRVCIEGGLSNADIVNTFSEYKGKDFRIKNANRNSSKISTKTLRTMIELIFDAERQLKSTGADKRFILEKLISELMLANTN